MECCVATGGVRGDPDTRSRPSPLFSMSPLQIRGVPRLSLSIGRRLTYPPLSEEARTRLGHGAFDEPCTA